jgi:hypothetical protein
MWKCHNCNYPRNDELSLECQLCEVPRGFDPEAETKELPAILIEDKKPRVGPDSTKK